MFDEFLLWLDSVLNLQGHTFTYNGNIIPYGDILFSCMVFVLILVVFFVFLKFCRLIFTRR